MPEMIGVQVADEPPFTREMELCPWCAAEASYEQEHLDPILKQLQPLRVRQRIASRLEQIANQEAICRAGIPALEEKIKTLTARKKLRTAKKQQTAAKQLLAYYEAERKKTLKRQEKYGRLTTDDEVLMQSLERQHLVLASGRDKIAVGHPRCAACTILLGPGHIMWDYDTVGDDNFCKTCKHKRYKY